MSTSAALPVSSSTGVFVRMLFGVFERHGVRYCVLHGWEELPETVSSDLDLVIHPEDFSKLPAVFDELAHAGYKWIQCRYYAENSYRFDFAWFDGKDFNLVGVDCVFEYRYAGLILCSGQELLKNRRPYNGFWIASAETVFAYLLMKKTLKGSMSEVQLQSIQQVSDEISAERSRAIAIDLFGSATGERIMRGIADSTLPMMLPKMRKELKRSVLSKNPWSFVRYHVDDKLRLVKRWFQPTGLLLVVLGPDGVGKSTVVQQLTGELKEAFRSTHFFHYRPTFGPRSTDIVTDPHGKTPRGALLSALRSLLLVVQFWIGYVFLVRQHLGRSGFVVFDRYFTDLLVDHRRYRYSGPDWVLKLFYKFVPKPDLYLVLDADDAVILSRKQEVSPEHLARLRRGYKALASSLPNATLVRTDQDLKDSTKQAVNAIYQFMMRRAVRRYPKWTRGFDNSASAQPVRVDRGVEA